MQEDPGLDNVLEMVRSWDYVSREKFYDRFPETVRQEGVNELFGVNQHEDEGFAEDYNPEDLNEETLENLQDDLSALSALAGREAASVQNLTVYGHMMDLWRIADDSSQLFDYLEAYADQRSDWDERDELDEADHLNGREQIDFGDEENEYIADIVSDLVERTAEEV